MEIYFLRTRRNGHHYYAVTTVKGSENPKHWVYHSSNALEVQNWIYRFEMGKRIQQSPEPELRGKWCQIHQDFQRRLPDAQTERQAWWDLPIEQIKADLERYQQDTGLPWEFIGI